MSLVHVTGHLAVLHVSILTGPLRPVLHAKTYPLPIRRLHVSILTGPLRPVLQVCLESRLGECNAALSGFETKYGMPFAEFVVAWQAGNIPQRHSYEVERDFMEWEARQMEHSDLLAAVQDLSRPDAEP